MRQAKLLITLLLFCGMYSCQKQQRSIPPLPPLDVNVVQVGKKDISLTSEYIGQTYGASDVEIQARIDGWVTSINFKEGEAVKKGQLLYTLDDQLMRNQIDQAYARLAQANTQLTKCRSDLSRVEPLAAMNALSKRELDAARAAEEAAGYEVAAAKAALKSSEVQLSYTKVTAPISGIIGISNVQVGDYVGKVSSKPLNTISALGSVRVRFSVSEEDYLRYARQKDARQVMNFPMELVLSDGAVYTEPGQLDLADRTIDPQTGSILVQAVFQNKKGLLKPGQYIKLRMTTREIKDAVLVPQQAINQMQEIYLAFVVGDDNQVTPRQVKTGPRIGSNWVITEGLNGSERVAMVGNAAVKANSVINPVEMAWNYDSTSISNR